MFGIIGNILVLFTILGRKEMQTPSNYFIMSLTVSDLGCLLLALPSFAFMEYAVFTVKVAERKFCRSYFVFLKIFLFCSIYTHVAIALERRRVIVFPMKPKLTCKTLKMSIVSVWIAVTACIAPLYGVLGIEGVGDCGIPLCKLNLEPNSINNVLYLITMFLSVWFVPFGVLVWSYRQICCCLKQHLMPTGKTQDLRLVLRSKQNKKIIRIFITFVTSFALANITSFFRFVLEFLGYFGIYPISSNQIATIMQIAHIIYFGSFSINPFILYFMSGQYHQAFNNAFKRCFRKISFKLSTSVVQKTLPITLPAAVTCFLRANVRT